MHAKTHAYRFGAVAVFSGILGFAAGQWASAREPAARLFPLLSSKTTATGGAITYPTGSPAQVSSFVLTLQPGEETGWHTHNVPGFGYILEGEVTVDYEGYGARIYKTGDALIEAVGVAHNGRNNSTEPMRILAVFMGADGIKTTDVLAKKPASNP